MKMTQLLIITLLLAPIFGCSKQDGQATTDTQLENTPAIEKSAEVMPPVSTEKPKKMLPNEISADDTTTEIEQDDSGKKVMFWHDPMVAGRRFSKSGQSPFMDMQLVPNYAEDGDKGAKP
jgi:hypothetical protein